eukprot:scaffold2806_cov135-Isochrysis_galbana.AAC.5
MCRRVPCRKARLRYGRGEVRGVWRRSGRERLAPGLLFVGRWIGHHCFTYGHHLTPAHWAGTP